MKLLLRCHKTREIVELELPNTSTIYDLRRRIYPREPSFVRLWHNRKGNLLLPHSPKNTLRSLGITSGDIIYYSIDHYSFVASVQDIGLASSIEAHKALVPNGESSGLKLIEYATPCSQSNRNQKFDQKSIEYQAEGSTRGKSGVEGPEPMDAIAKLAAGKRKRVSEPFFLKNILLEKSGDTSDLTTLAISVHAVMLDSGFLLLDPVSDRFSFSKELLSVSLRYTLPELMTRNGSNTIESVTLKFQSLGCMVVVYGTQGGSMVHRVYLDKHKFLRAIDLVMDTLKFDKQGTSSYYPEVFTFWRMVKDGLIIPLLTGLCDKAGLEPPPCLMLLPTELKLKILESLPGVSVAKMACVCTEMRYLASDNDLWKQKCLEECRKLVVTESGNDVNWKEKFVAFWRQNQRVVQEERRNFPIRNSFRYPRIILDHYTRFNGDRLHGSFGVHRGQPARRIDGRGWRQFWS